MFIRRVIVVCTLLAMLPIGACSQAAVNTPTPTTITIAGATGMRPVLQELADEFTRQHPNVLFDLRGGGSVLGEERLAAGEIDIAATTLLPPPEEGDTTSFVRTPIGLDGLAIVMHASNPVAELSVLQVRELFSGRILDWADVGGIPGDILLVSREDGAGARLLFEERVMGDARVSLTAVVMPTSADVVEYVGEHRQAIGYVSAAFVDETNSGASPVRVAQLEGRLPVQANLLNQDYWLIQPLYLVTDGEPTAWNRQFIDFVLSGPGQEIVARYHARVRE